tara:strand:+ start:4016 stop:4204 length:189 start_codon:yes stop_codon:yes gene_type:complete
MGTKIENNMIDPQIQHEAACSKIRVREHLLRTIEESNCELDLTIESEWSEMSHSGEFEAILA